MAHLSRDNVQKIIIAGWAGRDQAALQHHIDELAELGVAPPNTTPCFYPVGRELVTSYHHIHCLGEDSSGEVEYFVYMDQAEKIWIGVGSDHTDRESEAYSVNFSKQVCPKPVGPQLWDFDSVLAHWDDLILKSWIGDQGPDILYQEGSISALLHPHDMLEKFRSSGHTFEPGTLIFGGTIPVIGKIRPAPYFQMELHDPIKQRSLTHHYDVTVLKPEQ